MYASANLEAWLLVQLFLMEGIISTMQSLSLLMDTAAHRDCQHAG